MVRWLAIVVAASALAAPLHAQLFQQFFGQGMGAQNMFSHGAREQEAVKVGDASWFRERVKNAKCDEYLCKDTLACVDAPQRCPCPFAEQTRCEIGDAVVCMQAADCHAAEQLYRAA
ncbi:Long chronological lifespan protein 2 [Malassezia sp. CBS 17886]|nr:Long chronological lifespan protein 2 [Malassezia sp. CBS 17886]